MGVSTCALLQFPLSSTHFCNKTSKVEHISQALGNSKITITQRRYAKPDDDRIKPVINFLNYKLPENI